MSSNVFSISEIDDDPQYNSRGVIEPVDVDYLVKDIALRGQLVPIIIRPIEGGEKKYRVVAGFSRCLAMRVLREKKILATLKEYNDEEAMIVNVSENLVRKDLTILQEAKALAWWGLRK